MWRVTLSIRMPNFSARRWIGTKKIVFGNVDIAHKIHASMKNYQDKHYERVLKTIGKIMIYVFHY